MGCVVLRGRTRRNDIILTLADVCEPFVHNGRRWAIDKMWGAYLCDRNGDPTNKPVSGERMEEAYQYWMEHLSHKVSWGKSLKRSIAKKEA